MLTFAREFDLFLATHGELLTVVLLNLASAL